MFRKISLHSNHHILPTIKSWSKKRVFFLRRSILPDLFITGRLLWHKPLRIHNVHRIIGSRFIQIVTVWHLAVGEIEKSLSVDPFSVIFPGYLRGDMLLKIGGGLHLGQYQVQGQGFVYNEYEMGKAVNGLIKSCGPLQPVA